MKYIYTGNIPTLIVKDGDLVQINKGDVESLRTKPSDEWVVQEKAPAKKVMATTPTLSKEK